MRKAARLFEIIQILRLARKPVTGAAMAETLEVTVRSIYRDIAALQAMRVPIEGGRGIGYILRPGFDLPPLMFSIEETEAIAVALALLSRTGDEELKAAAGRVNKKITAAVPEPLRLAFRSQALHAWGTITPSPAGIDLALVRRAIRDEQEARTQLSRRTRPRDGADDPARGADLLFRNCQHRCLVRIAAGYPQFPRRPRRTLRGGGRIFSERRQPPEGTLGQRLENATDRGLTHLLPERSPNEKTRRKRRVQTSCTENERLTWPRLRTFRARSPN